MSIATVTITDITQTPQSLFSLLTKGTQAGYTVAPAGGVTPSLTLIAGVIYMSIQASYTNGGAIVYRGDANVKTDGSRQAKELLAGDTDVMQLYPIVINLNQIYITASANGAKVNIEAHHG